MSIVELNNWVLADCLARYASPRAVLFPGLCGPDAVILRKMVSP